MTKLQEYRARAVKLLLEKADKVVPMLIDYQLDDFLRNLLDLPVRPDNQPPYFGWLLPAQDKPALPTKISQVGIELIKRWEGCRLKAYQCPAKVWTIGYGHTATAKPGMCISYEQAEELLKRDIERYEQAVVSLVNAPINQNQFDALVSFAFNCGINALATSTLLSLLNRKSYIAAAEQFLRWTKAGNVTLKGLVQRRKEEYELFMS